MSDTFEDDPLIEKFVAADGQVQYKNKKTGKILAVNLSSERAREMNEAKLLKKAQAADTDVQELLEELGLTQSPSARMLALAFARGSGAQSVSAAKELFRLAGFGPESAGGGNKLSPPKPGEKCPTCGIVDLNGYMLEISDMAYQFRQVREAETDAKDYRQVDRNKLPEMLRKLSAEDLTWNLHVWVGNPNENHRLIAAALNVLSEKLGSA